MKHFLLTIFFCVLVYHLVGQTIVTLTLPNNCNSTVSVQSEEFKKGPCINIYPNPNDGEFSLQVAFTSVPGKSKINIRTTNGNVVYSEIVYSNSKMLVKQLKLSYLSSGHYILEIVSDTQIISTQFIKQ